MRTTTITHPRFEQALGPKGERVSLAILLIDGRLSKAFQGGSNLSYAAHGKEGESAGESKVKRRWIVSECVRKSLI